MAAPGEPSAAERRRLMGVDLGARRIGLAIGDPETRSSVPLRTLSRGRDVAADAAVIARVAVEQGVAALVVGLPLDMDGSEGPQARSTREWAAAVASITGLPVRFRDERLSSERAEKLVGSAGRGPAGGPPGRARRDAHRARLDREAAALILQDDLDAMSDDDTERRSR